MTKDKETKKEVAPKASTEVAKPEHAPRGFEHEDTSDLLLPRVELLQGLSPAVQQGKGKAGDIVDNVGKQPFATDIFIPIAMHRKYIKWIPRDEGGGIEYQTTDRNDPRVKEDTKWGAHGEKPSCTAYMNFLILMEGQMLPTVLSFAMTNYNTGKKLYTLCKMTGQDMWMHKYKLSSLSRTNNMGTWHVFEVDEAGKTGEREIAIAEQLYHSFATRDLNFEVEAGAQPKAEASKDEDY
jgi:hypothetical protein